MCLLVHGAGLFSLPPIDRDESRFAQASRQMLESGDWVVPRVQDTPRLNKPPLVYWLQAASAWACSGGDVLRDAIWMYRLPSLLCVIASVLITWRLGLAIFGPWVGFLAAVLLAVCPLVVFDAHQARADQLLLTTTLLAQWALWRVWHGGGIWAVIGLWVALALGIMAKGPVTPMIVGLTVLALCVRGRDWGLLAAVRPVLGVLIIALIAGPWLLAIGERIGWEQYTGVVRGETLGRSLEAREGHWGPPGYHTLLAAVLFWPGSLVTLAAVWRAGRGTAGLDRGGVFCLAWLLPAWVVFELVGTKLPHYTMPLYPALAILSARFLVEHAGAPARRDRLGAAVWILIGALITTGVCGVLSVAVLTSAPIGVRAITVVMLALIMLALGVAARWAWRGMSLGATAAGVAAAVLSHTLLLGVLLPRHPAPWISPALAALIEHADPAGDRPLACAGYQEDSLIFLTRGRAQRLTVEEALPWLGRTPGALLVIPEEMALRAQSAAVLGVIEGWNYSKGRTQRVAVVERP